MAWTNEQYTGDLAPSKDSGEAYAGTEFMTERLKVFDLLTRFTWYPSLTVSGRQRVNYKLDIDFNRRLVLANRAVRELRQPPAYGPVKERLRLVECLRPEVLTSARLSVPEGGLS